MAFFESAEEKKAKTRAKVEPFLLDGEEVIIFETGTFCWFAITSTRFIGSVDQLSKDEENGLLFIPLSKLSAFRIRRGLVGYTITLFASGITAKFEAIDAKATAVEQVQKTITNLMKL